MALLRFKCIDSVRAKVAEDKTVGKEHIQGINDQEAGEKKKLAEDLKKDVKGPEYWRKSQGKKTVKPKGNAFKDRYQIYH